MKRNIQKKLRSRRGETIAETLIALLISALALMMLAGAITSSSQLITLSKNKMAEYHQANEAVEMHTGTSGGTWYIGYSKSEGKITINKSSSDQVTVAFYENDKMGAAPVVSYKIKKIESGG